MPLDLRRQVTMVFQRPMLLNRSIQANVNFGLELRGIRDSKERVQAALAEVGLEQLANQKAHTPLWRRSAAGGAGPGDCPAARSAAAG